MWWKTYAKAMGVAVGDSDMPGVFVNALSV